MMQPLTLRGIATAAKTHPSHPSHVPVPARGYPSQVRGIEMISALSFPQASGSAARGARLARVTLAPVTKNSSREGCRPPLAPLATLAGDPVREVAK